MHNCRCVMSQPRYFKVDACQDCTLCKKQKQKTRGFNQLASITKCRPRRHPQFHHVPEYHILTVSHWLTRSSNTKTDSAAAEFNIPTKNCVGLGAVRVQQSLEREPNCWHVDHSGRKKKERTNKQEIEKAREAHTLENNKSQFDELHSCIFIRTPSDGLTSHTSAYHRASLWEKKNVFQH